MKIYLEKLRLEFTNLPCVNDFDIIQIIYILLPYLFCVIFIKVSNFLNILKVNKDE